MSQNYCIYKHTSPSGKSYIGQTKNYKRRIREHKTQNRCVLFHKAIIKYTFEAFTTEILAENLTQIEANNLECFYIEKHNTISPNGYNLMSGGLNSTHSKEVIEKMVSSRRGYKPSLETKEKIRVANTGKKMSEEQKRKISTSMKGKPSHWLGKKQTKEHIENRVKAKSSNKSSIGNFVGVSWHKTNKKWQAQITINGKRKHLGYFSNEESAYDAVIRSESETE